MVRNLLVRGMLAGLVGGLVTALFAWLFGEPSVAGAIAALLRSQGRVEVQAIDLDETEPDEPGERLAGGHLGRAERQQGPAQARGGDYCIDGYGALAVEADANAVGGLF